MSPCKANTMTLPEVGLTPDAPRRRNNLNKTSRGGEGCVLRKRNCGCCCENEAQQKCCYGMSKITFGEEFIKSNLHPYWRV